VIRQTAGAIEPADRLLLEAWAEPVDGEFLKPDPALTRRAVERGHNAETFAEFLRDRDRDPQPLPQTVEGFLAAAEQDGRAVRFRGEALLFDCRRCGKDRKCLFIGISQRGMEAGCRLPGTP